MSQSKTHSLFARITPEALAALDAASERIGVSRAATVEVLIRAAARKLTAADVPPKLAGKLWGRPGGGRRKKPKKSST